ncbi:uncharacterized protein LOC130613883 [Hydractinia symbiolongicarpus]|uniref:uncharacterized protein LOC130613883 n=1 Tax=Hydractinia symbiolongicarpus TaxID=13093 RepID=UPI00254B3244|nr:uncharacterized protein LOC130613883 [Hydractinia symbiolongicarpus]
MLKKRKKYIKPLQENLDLTHLKENEVVCQENIMNRSGPEIKCSGCSHLFPIKSLEAHKAFCTPTVVSQVLSSCSDDEDEEQQKKKKKQSKINFDKFLEQEPVERLNEMFPEKDYESLSKTLEENSFDITDTIDELLLIKSCFSNNASHEVSKVCNRSHEVSKIFDIKDALEVLSSQLYETSKSLDVKPDSIFNDIMSYYKDSNFNPK